MELNNTLQERRTAESQSLSLALRMSHFSWVFFYLSGHSSVLLSSSPFPHWLSERRPFGISFIIIYFLPKKYHSRPQLSLPCKQWVFPTFHPQFSEFHSIPFHSTCLLYLHFGFGKDTSNSTPRTKIHDPIPICFNSSITYLSERKLHNMLIVQDGKLGLGSKIFFFYPYQLCIHSITKYCWAIFLNIPLIHPHTPSLLPPYTQMPSVLTWPN